MTWIPNCSMAFNYRTCPPLGTASISSLVCSNTLTTHRVSRRWLNWTKLYGLRKRCFEHSWLGVCVYLLKRSKTCTSSGWWISCWRIVDWNILSLWSSITRFAVWYKIIRHVTTGKHFIAGACGTHVLPHATKLWAWVGSKTWPVLCTCNMNIDIVIKLCLVGVLLGFLFQVVASP